MASDAASPLLEPLEGSSAISWQSVLRELMNPKLWGKVADCIVLLLAAVGVVCSTYLLASTSTDSVCVKIYAPDLFKTSLLIIPICLMVPVVSTSGIIREAFGAQGGALVVVQAICGVMLMDWMSICMWGASAWWVL
ncbi:hypothetical protein C2845_PM09G09100 [Panicum miliaceum]|uniref:Uncharacterized protein n=1 Tax=Panicum miliaceum TaxID=4540 RepID=A0A3L6S2A2_PANMI|nr:hypothetical protein C2845_PM09G09100 [Panicum miliaceum]